MNRLNPGIVAPALKGAVILSEIAINAGVLLFLIWAFDPSALDLYLINALCFYPLWISYNLLVGYLLWNLMPNIYYDSDGLSIYMIRQRILIPWDSIITIKKGMLLDFIVCRKITPVHRIYGILFGWTILPCIGVSSDPKIRDKLYLLVQENKV